MESSVQHQKAIQWQIDVEQKRAFHEQHTTNFKGIPEARRGSLSLLARDPHFCGSGNLYRNITRIQMLSRVFHNITSIVFSIGRSDKTSLPTTVFHNLPVNSSGYWLDTSISKNRPKGILQANSEVATMAETVLSSNQRQELLNVLQELDPTAPTEKRRSARRKVLKSLWIRNLTNTGARGLRKAVLENVSKRGVGLLVHRAMTKGDKFLLPLDFEDGSGWLVLCEARNCRRLASGQFKVGAGFIDRVERQGEEMQVPADWLCY
jgi:hypothetical protein